MKARYKRFAIHKFLEDIDPNVALLNETRPREGVNIKLHASGYITLHNDGRVIPVQTAC